MTGVTNYRCVPSRFGWSASPLPRPEEIAAYYQEKYYQEPSGQYSIGYDPEELRYFFDRSQLTLAFAASSGITNGRVLDIGCGEGFFLKDAAASGFDVWGVDHSLFGMDQHNRGLADASHFKEVNVLDVADYFDGLRFDLIVCKNVVEHVIDPDILMARIASHLNPNGIGIVEIPNDYSVIHNRMIGEGAREEFPIFCPPVHLHYFSAVTAKQLVERAGLHVIDGFADYPIDHLLLEERFNYYENRELGRDAHSLRRNFMNLVGEIPIRERLNLFRAIFNAGLGRDISLVFRR